MISVVIIAKDEEKMLPDCLESIGRPNQWASEIILVDNDSKDKTVELAKNWGAKIVRSKTQSFSESRNKGAAASSCEWILYIDADERVTPELAKEIKNLLMPSAQPLVPNPAYAIPRRNFILGQELRFGGWWPDYVKRLFRKDKLKSWEGQLHEEPVFEGELGHLKNPLVHIKHENFSEMVEKTDKWSDIEAKLMFEANHPRMNVLRFLSGMAREFWHRMIVKAAFLDGTTGIMFALYQVFSRFISYAKLWELQLEKPKT